MAFFESVNYLVKAIKLILWTLPLLYQIRRFTRQLKNYTAAQYGPINLDRVRDLEDEIFGRKIEVECLLVKARRLNRQAY